MCAPISKTGRGLLGVVLLTQLGCGSTVSLKHRRFDYRDEVAQVHVGVQSVAPFEDYVDALQPRFDLTAAAALDAAVAQTQNSEIRRLQALALSLKAGLPQTGVTSSDVTTTTGGTTSTSSTTTSTKTPGTLDSAPAPPAVIGSLPDVLAGPAATSPQLDAALRYRAATALYQEVSLLSRYVRDAAVARNETPYVVRFLVSVFPSARLSPYDAYVTVSFAHKYDPDLEPVLRGDNYSRLKAYSDLYRRSQSTPSTVPPPPALMEQLKVVDSAFTEVKAAIDEAKTKLTAANKTAPDCANQPAHVVPLFVTDTFESSLDSTALLGSRDLGLSLGGTVSGVALGAGLSDRLEDERRWLNRGLNGLYTLGSPSDHSLEVRLGAAYAGDLYVMVPRTYSLTALVLAQSQETVFTSSSASAIVPCNSITFTTTYDFYDADKGTLVPPRPTTPENGTTEAKSAAATAGGTTANGAAASAPSFALPNAQAAFQRPLLYGTVQDDGKVAKLSITGGAGLVAETASAVLKVPAVGTNKALSLIQTNATVNAARTAVTFEFPSVRSLRGCDKQKATSDPKPAAGGGKPPVVKAKKDAAPPPAPPAEPDPCGGQYSVETDIQAAHFSWSRLSERKIMKMDVDHVQATVETPATAKFQVAIPAGRVLASADGLGSLQVLLRAEKPVTGVLLSVDGGEIIGIAGLTLAGSDWTLNAPAAYNLSLRNLLPNTAVTIKAWQMVDSKRVDAAPQTAAVVSLPPRPVVHTSATGAN
jgi:hypothetical protein